jgi:hypothetical protein
MKSIQPKTVHTGGLTGTDITATQLAVIIEQDDLATKCQVVFQLFQADGTPVLEAEHCSIDGADYQNWNGDNAYPYQYVANRYNLSLIQ